MRSRRYPIILAMLVVVMMVGVMAATGVVGQGTAQEPEVTLVGVVSRPVGPQQVQPLEGFDLYLRDLDHGLQVRVRTGKQGSFRFSGLRPGGLYYMIGISHLQFEDAAPRLRAVPSGNGTVIWMPDLSVRAVDWAVSWHQAVTVDRPGTYSLALTALNIDPEFCPDLEPTYDQVSRAPFRSWRRAVLQEVPAPKK